MVEKGDSIKEVVITAYDHNRYVKTHPQLTAGDTKLIEEIHQQSKYGITLFDLATLTLKLMNQLSEEKNLTQLQLITIQTWFRSYLIETLGEENASSIFRLWST